MNRFLACVTALALGCGGSSSGTDPDGGLGGTDGSGSDDGDGGGSNQTGQTVTLTLTNRPNNGQQFTFLVAYQDGGAEWKLAGAPTGDTYSFPIIAPSFGVAYTCISNVNGTQQRTVTTAFFAVSERTSLTLDVPTRCSDRAGDGVLLSGALANLPGQGVIIVQYGGRTTFADNSTGEFSMRVPTGTRDLIISHAVPTGNGDFYTDDVLVDRGVAVNADTALDLDFADAQKNAYWSTDMTAAPNSAKITGGTTLYTANGTSALLVRETQSWDTDGLAEAWRIGSDVYDESIAVQQLGSGITRTHATSTPGPQTYEAADPLGEIQTTVATQTPYVTLQTTWSAYDNAVGYLWNAGQSCGSGCTRGWQAYVSPGVVGAQPAFRMPDLSTLSGWDNGFELHAGFQVLGSVTANVSSAGAEDFPTGIPADGTDRLFVRTDYGVTP